MADSKNSDTGKFNKITQQLENKEETDNTLTVSTSAPPGQSPTPIAAIPGQPSAPTTGHSPTSTPATSSEQSPAPTQLEPKDIDTLKFQVLMKDIDIRSAEINARIPSQTQTITTLATLSGGFAALAGFLFGAAHVPFIPWGPVICLIYSFIVLTFAWTNLDHDIQMADIGNYLEDDVRKQLRAILKMEEKQQEEIFSWGNYRINRSIRRQYARADRNPCIRFASRLSSLSRYGSMIALAVISDIIAIYGAINSIQGLNWKTPLSIIQCGEDVAIIIIGVFVFIYGILLGWLAVDFRNKVEEIKGIIFKPKP
jgi:hypothetical protein